MVTFGKRVDDVEYYKGIFIDLGCPVELAWTLAKGHLGVEVLTKPKSDIKDLMLQGISYDTAQSMIKGYDRLNHLDYMLGYIANKQLLNDLVHALSNDKAKELFDFVCRMRSIPPYRQ